MIQVSGNRFIKRLRAKCYCCSIANSCPTLGDPGDCSMPGFPGLCKVLQQRPTESKAGWSHVFPPSEPVPSHLMLSRPRCPRTAPVPRLGADRASVRVSVLWTPEPGSPQASATLWHGPGPLSVPPGNCRNRAGPSPWTSRASSLPSFCSSLPPPYPRPAEAEPFSI